MAKYLNLDTEDTPDQYTKIIFDSVVYILRLRYNNRTGWRLSLYDYNTFDSSLDDNSESQIFGERTLMPNQNIFKYNNGVSSLPTGYLFLYDTEDPDISEYEYPTRYNLGSGNRFKLVYFSKTEYESYLS